MAEFLLKGFHTAPAENPERAIDLLQLWRSFEEHKETFGSQRGQTIESIKTRFFEKLIEEIEKTGFIDAPFLTEGVPMGYLFLQVGNFDQAIQSLQSSIARAPENSSVYGYLGDAYWLRGDQKTARQCYREGCFIDPHAIDWAHLQDQHLKELKDDLLLEYGLDHQLAIAWLPSHARICGLFEKKLVRLHDGMKEMVKRYLTLRKNLQNGIDSKLAARLFLVGLTLCENEEYLKFVKNIDLIQVRKEMQQANPDLFEEFLEDIVKTKLSKCK